MFTGICLIATALLIAAAYERMITVLSRGEKVER